ncbi:MAG: MazG-like family protein [Halobacteriales archaeon]|nr:MazG-like family protein [Halobacteriales archaeon]
MDEQARVAAFVEAHDLQADPAHRVLDLASEVGEVAKEVNRSTAYGATDDVAVAADEIGDTLFALLALAEAVDVDAGEALESAIAKYEARLEERGDAGSA